MEGAFKSRLDQIFGGLGSESSWSVSDSQLDRRQWRPAEAIISDDEDEQRGTCASQGERDEEESSPKRPRRNASDEEEEEDIERMVGMDTTLDSEDEEDEYDKVAVGREGRDDRFYTNDLKGGGSSTQVRSFREAGRRDDRALHRGAAERLAEDAREAQLSGSADAYKRFSGSVNEKRKQGVGGDVSKRVRFQVEETSSKKEADRQRPPRSSARYKNVADHVMHPEKYTYYSLDWTEEDQNKSSDNVGAWRATMELVDGAPESEQGTELPERITFVPRPKEKRVEQSRASPAARISIAASDMMEEDEIENPGESKLKSTPAAAKSYRSRARDEDT